MGHLKQNGYQITADAADAETVVVNTCGFIDSAKKESIDTILEAAQLKTNGQAKRLIVAGCLVERYRDELKAEIPEVDAFHRHQSDQRHPRRLRSQDQHALASGRADRQSERDLSLRRIDAARVGHAFALRVCKDRRRL